MIPATILSGRLKTEEPSRIAGLLNRSWSGMPLSFNGKTYLGAISILWQTACPVSEIIGRIEETGDALTRTRRDRPKKIGSGSPDKDIRSTCCQEWGVGQEQSFGRPLLNICSRDGQQWSASGATNFEFVNYGQLTISGSGGVANLEWLCSSGNRGSIALLEEPSSRRFAQLKPQVSRPEGQPVSGLVGPFW